MAFSQPGQVSIDERSRNETSTAFQRPRRPAERYNQHTPATNNNMRDNSSGFNATAGLNSYLELQQRQRNFGMNIFQNRMQQQTSNINNDSRLQNTPPASASQWTPNPRINSRSQNFQPRGGAQRVQSQTVASGNYANSQNMQTRNGAQRAHAHPLSQSGARFEQGYQHNEAPGHGHNVQVGFQSDMRPQQSGQQAQWHQNSGPQSQYPVQGVQYSQQNTRNMQPNQYVHQGEGPRSRNYSQQRQPSEPVYHYAQQAPQFEQTVEYHQPQPYQAPRRNTNAIAQHTQQTPQIQQTQHTQQAQQTQHTTKLANSMHHKPREVSVDPATALAVRAKGVKFDELAKLYAKLEAEKEPFPLIELRLVEMTQSYDRSAVMLEQFAQKIREDELKKAGVTPQMYAEAYEKELALERKRELARLNQSHRGGFGGGRGRGGRGGGGGVVY